MSAKPYIIELDFGMGNIRSLQKAFEHLGFDVEVSSDAAKIKSADALLLPGDGAFKKAMQELASRHMLDEIHSFYQSKKPILGICIGFQILHESSSEFGEQQGLGYLEGMVSKFDSAPDINIPHMGWSKTKINSSARLTEGLPDELFFYYVHSYRVGSISENTVGSCDYNGEFSAIIEKDNLYGTQFHPEKSHSWGLKILENFAKVI